MSDNVQNQISELKVSGHTMALDPGIYCIFSAPNSAPPAADTGLPTVRISEAPGPSAGSVAVVGLNGHGWIGPSGATLVRVEKARSNVLVTVYQAKDTRADAPQLQVVRISGDAPAPAAAPARAVAAPTPALPSEPGRKPKEVSAIAHIYGRGDVGGAIGEWVGEPGSKRWIEGFGLAPVGIVEPADIEYQAVLGRGWLSPWSQGGQFCGSRSMSLPILGLSVRLRGDAAKTHQVRLEASFIDGSTVGPVGGGEPCEAPSLAALEAFRIFVEPLGATASAPAAAKPAAKGRKPAAKQPEPAQPAAKGSKSAAAAKTPPAPVAKPRATRTPGPTRRR